jgi:aminomethyltransferase
MKRTPLYNRHISAGARMIEFGGWQMPVQYSGVIEEHRATRGAAGLFDICHMGEIMVTGSKAFDLLQKVMSRELAPQKDGKMRLSVMTNPDGGILDDLTIYKFSDERFMVVTNAVTKQKDFEWIVKNKAALGIAGVSVEDVTESMGKLDLQGPDAQSILQRIVNCNLAEIKYYSFLETELAGFPALISRSGYTGEDGFEIYMDSSLAEKFWDIILEEGGPDGLKPVGLGARDTLRLEAGLMLYGNEMDELVTPLEVAYSWVPSLEKDFIGRDALKRQKETGLSKKLIGFEMVDRGIARHGYKIVEGEEEIGIVTSGSMTPTLNKAVGMGFAPMKYQEPGTDIFIRIRENTARARVVPLPFYKRAK